MKIRHLGNWMTGYRDFNLAKIHKALILRVAPKLIVSFHLAGPLASATLPTLMPMTMLQAQPVPVGIEEELREAFHAGLPIPAAVEPQLGGALRRTLSQPGSLVRARLAYEMARAFQMPDAQAKQLAIAIEYLHTASLLFDDLPCMDDATERRGGPCVHRVHGEAAAMLAALGLVNRAYALLWQGLADCPSDRQTRAVDCVEQCLGVTGLLNGQSQDLNYLDLPEHRRWPEKIAAKKTAPLIRLALVLPALAGGAGPAETLLMNRLAVYWGIGYQILDDLKDAGWLPGRTGKTGARDEALHRPNLALADGAELAVLRLERLLGLADAAMEQLLALLPAAIFLTDLRSQFQAGLAGVQLTVGSRERR